ncbi:hypothetical protein ACJRO7_023006 [Eucalyptus globulus]|uniref:Uncharacterized protein n=1 Tax=Eucalyptus globulus TaxID=34317 RepID=A0ABD3K3V8_EUCGL
MEFTINEFFTSFDPALAAYKINVKSIKAVEEWEEALSLKEKELAQSYKLLETYCGDTNISPQVLVNLCQLISEATYESMTQALSGDRVQKDRLFEPNYDQELKLHSLASGLRQHFMLSCRPHITSFGVVFPFKFSFRWLILMHRLLK